MRLTAPELSARYREGMLREGAHVIDAGQIGSEMLYFLVGSRALDGGLMCTASHNPAAYTGAKLVREGALALSGDTGIQEIRRTIEGGLDGDDRGGGDGGSASSSTSDYDRRARSTSDDDTRARGTYEEIDIYKEFQQAALCFIDPDAIRPLKVVVDGGNGMAGPMVGPLLERLGLDLIETYWTPDGAFPDHEPNPLLPENRKFIIEKVLETGADLGIAWDGDARSLLLHRRHRRVRGRGLPHRAARRVAAGQERARPAKPSCTTCAPRARCPTRSLTPGASPTSTASGTRSSRRACAPRARCSGARSPGITTSATSTARTRARCPRC